MKSRIFTPFTHKIRYLTVCFFTFIFIFSALAQQDTEDEELARMQAQLNANVMAQPFLAEKPEEVDAYIKSMIEKKVKPTEYNGIHWRPGYTCRDLLRYNWTEYRNCRYYYQYYGRYY